MAANEPAPAETGPQTTAPVPAGPPVAAGRPDGPAGTAAGDPSAGAGRAVPASVSAGGAASDGPEAGAGGTVTAAGTANADPPFGASRLGGPRDTAAGEPPVEVGGPGGGRRVTGAVGVPVAVAVLLGLVYLAAPPMGTDLAAQVARAEFFAAHGWAPLDFGWYGGTSPYGYSLISPPLMVLLGGGVVGAKLLGAVAAVLSTAALAVLLVRTGARRPVLGGVAGAICFAGNLVSGRTTYALGVAFGLLALGLVSKELAGPRRAQTTTGGVAAPPGYNTVSATNRRLVGGGAGSARAGRGRAGTSVAPGLRLGFTALLKKGLAAAAHPSRRVRLGCALPCAVLTALTSPVAALFLGLAGAAWALSGITRVRPNPADPGGVVPGLADPGGVPGGQRDAWGLPFRCDRRRLRTGLLLMIAAGVPMLAMAVPFGAGGWMNISRWDTYRAAGVSLLVALLVPRRPVRIGALLSTAGVVTAYAVHTPVGLNATRLAVMFALPLLAGYVPIPVPRRLPAPARPWLRATGVAAVLVGAALWQPPVATPDLRGAGDPAAEPGYFAPLLAELERRAPVGRVEVVPLANYWDAAYVPAAAPLARGWLRQADLAYNPMFFDGKLTATEYGAWLRDNGVSYVALADAEPSWIGRVEASLVRAGLPYLTRVWSGGHWSLYRVSGSPSIVDGAELVRSGPAGLTLDAPAGRTLVRVRWSPWLSVRGRPDGGGANRSGGDAVDGGDGGACLAQRGDWIELRADRPGRYEITGSLTTRGPFCP